VKHPQLALALCAAVLSGCATVMYGSGAKLISIESRPPGASVLVLPDEILVETPAQVRVSRRQSRTLRVEMEGYCRETIYIDRVNATASRVSLVLFVGVGLAVDYWTGAAYTLRPDHLEVILWPEHSPDRECGPASSLPRTTPLPPLEPL
jgi:hypothetical protein